MHTVGRCGCGWVGGLVSVGCDVYIRRCECGCVWGWVGVVVGEFVVISVGGGCGSGLGSKVLVWE